MKGIIFVLSILLTRTADAQTETFDIMHFIAPKDWKKEAKEGMISFTDVNENKGSFCVIVLFASTASKGDVREDFSAQWEELAVKPHQAKPVPETEETTSDGWKAMTAASPIKLEGVDCYIILTVFSGFGKKVSVLSSLNDSSYLAQLDELLKNIRLDKKPSDAKKIPASTSKETVSEKKPSFQGRSPQVPENDTMETFGHLLFTSMKDWTMQRYPTAIIFKPDHLPADRYIETRIMESRLFSGTMHEALDISWKDALNQLKLVSPYTSPYFIITEKKSFKGWDYIQCEGTVKRLDDPSELGYDKYYINLFVIKLNDRIERIVTAGSQNINGADYSLYNSSTYRDAILGLCFSLRFDDWKEPPVGVLKGEPLSGMYEGLKLKGGSLRGSYAVFFPNGQIFFGEKFPPSGFEGKNTWMYAELDTRNWGTYTLQNGKGTINMGYGNVPLRVSGTNLIVTTQNTDHVYERLPSVDGAVLNGRYQFDGDWGGKQPPTITFDANGNFTDEGALNILNHQTTDPDEFNVAAKTGKGSYQIKNYTMIFSYSDGRKLYIAFSGSGFDRKNPSPSSITLSFNNDILYKK